MPAFAFTLGKGLHASSMSWPSWCGGEDMNSQCIGQLMARISLQQIQK